MWARDAELLAHLLEMVSSGNVLARIDRVAGSVLVIEVVGEAAIGRIGSVVGIGIIGIIRRRICLAIKICTGIRNIKIADFALDGQRRLGKFVLAHFREEAVDFKVTERGIVTEVPVALEVLVQHRRRYGPVVVEVDLQCSATAVSRRVVEVFLHKVVVVDADPVEIAANDIAVAIADRRPAVGPAAGDVVDIARIMLDIAHCAERDPVGDGEIDHPLELATLAAVGDGVDLAVDAAFGGVQLGLVGDDADRARLARRAVKCPLRTGETLDPRNVVDMDVERAADRRDWLLVEIGADRRERARMIAVAAGGNAAHVDDGDAGLQGLEADRGELLGILLEIRDVELVEPLGADCLDRQWNLGEILFAFLRGDDDLVRFGRGVAGRDLSLGRGRRVDGARLGKGRRGKRRRGQQERAPTQGRIDHDFPSIYGGNAARSGRCTSTTQVTRTTVLLRLCPKSRGCGGIGGGDRAERVDQIADPRFVMAPFVERVAIDWLADLLA